MTTVTQPELMRWVEPLIGPIESHGGNYIVLPTPTPRRQNALQGLRRQIDIAAVTGRQSSEPKWRFAVRPRIEINKQLWATLDRPEWLTPDFVGWRDENAGDALPDWVCEITDVNWAYVRESKLPLYGRMGVPWVCIVDPVNTVIEEHKLVSGRYELAHVTDPDEGVAWLKAIPEVTLKLDTLWE